jgi:hypothetical protein
MKPRLRTRTRFPGITADARALSVNRATLFKMLRGYPGFANLKTLRALRRAETEGGGAMKHDISGILITVITALSILVCFIAAIYFAAKGDQPKAQTLLLFVLALSVPQKSGGAR